MSTSQTLQHLYSFNTFSPEFSRCLDRLIRSDDEDRYLFGLQGLELTRLVDFLDRALGIIPVTDDVSRRCLHKLQAICSHTGILPSSYIISGSLVTVGDYPVVSTNLSDVWEGKHGSAKVCIKTPKITLRDRRDIEKAFYKEAVTWKRLRHPNIVPFIGVAQNPLRFVSEWMPNGNLTEYLGENPGANRIGLLLDVAEGLAYLHAKHTIHGDLKGSNVLISRRGRARLTDFGFTSVVRGLNSTRIPQLQGCTGCTLRWAAPEVIRGESGGAQEADTYAFGMVVIEVFTGKCPFSELTDPVAVSEVMEGERPDRPQGHDLTDPVWGMTELCWQEDPVLRPRMKEAVAILRECHRLPISAAQQSAGRELLPSCGVSIPPPGSGNSALASSTGSLNRAGTIITLATPPGPASPMNPTTHTSGTRDADHPLGRPGILKRLFGRKKSEALTSRELIACPNCGVRPVAFKTHTGGYSDYCSMTCQAQARGSSLSQNAGQVAFIELCEQCQKNPKLRDGTGTHRYCSLTCATLATSSGSAPTSPTNSIKPANPANANTTRDADYTLPGTPTTHPSILGSNRAGTFNRILSSPVCKTPGCTMRVAMGENGLLSTYCSWTERGCISCRAAPMSEKFIMCEPCYDDVLDLAPVIVEVHRDHQIYKSVSSQFKQSWRHKTTCPEVRAIYRIISTKTSMDEYQQYLDGVETRGNFAARGRSRGNENRRWHGTRRNCNIGDRGFTKFCTDPACSLCCILQSSFDLKYFKGATGWGRFGSGIYLSSTSSKSNDYSKNVGITSDWKALLLNKVVVGNGKKLTTNDTSLTEPPQGHDSILAEVGGTLNCDELVVYNSSATRPAYLIMYDKLT